MGLKLSETTPSSERESEKDELKPRRQTCVVCLPVHLVAFTQTNN